MPDSKSQNTRINFRNKLSLKRSNSDRAQSTLSLKNISCPKNDVDKSDTCNPSISQNKSADNRPDVEDSLADFKSPKEEKVSKPILNKFKFEKVKRKLVKSNSKSTKPVVDTNQPSIEYSFLKPQTSNQPKVKEASPCPLCLKPFKDDVMCYNHMKSCAAKNKVSLQQLLDAKKLQERQAEERKEMGLLAAPIIPEKKKNFRSKNYSTGDDQQLQLVLAMSESLYEAEQQQELEQAVLLAGIPSECLKDINSEDRKTLQGFGFFTNRPPVEVPVRKKKRKFHGPTVLQSRSKEDKDRVLTERIACIITGDDALTQVQTTNLIEPSDKPSYQLRSRKLRTIEQLDNKLWDFSRLTKKCNNFYVEELRSHFLRTNEQKSQGRESESFAQVTIDENDTNIVLNASIEYEPVDIEFLVSQNEDSNSLEMSATDEMRTELDFIKNSNSKWVQALNSMTKSDLVILVQNNKKVYTHQLVLFVQCPQILYSKEPNDLLREGKIKEKISWLMYDQLSVLAFLEFVYCGCIEKHINFLEKKEVVKEVKKLAEKYNIKSLVKYIELKQNEHKLSKSKNSFVKRHRRDTNDSHSVHTNKSSIHSHIQKSPPPKEVNIYENYDDNNVYSNHSFDHSPVQQLKPLPTKKIISYENYKKTQGLSVITNAQQGASSKNVEKNRDIEMQVHMSAEKQDKVPQTSENDKMLSRHSKVLNTCVEISSKIPCTNTNVTSTPVNYPKSILKKSFTSSPILFESDDESIHRLLSQKGNQANTSILSQKCNRSETNLSSQESNQADTNISSQKSYQSETSVSLQKSNQAETRHDNTYLNILVDLANEEDKLASQNEGNQHSKCNSDDSKSEQNSPKTVIKLSQSPENLENLSPPSSKNIHDCLTPDREQNSNKNSSNKKNDSFTDNQSDNSANPETSTLSKTNHASKIMEVIEIDSENDESIYNAITPPRRNSDNFSPTCNTVLDSFLKKVRRKNIRDILETDSDSDVSIPQGRRNPFLTQNRDDSYKYLKNDGNNFPNRKVISILESEILTDEKLQNARNTESSTNNQTLNQSTDKNHNANISVNKEIVEDDDLQIIDDPLLEKSSNDTAFNDTKNNDKNDSILSSSDRENTNGSENESEMSMYSRYKKHNVHNNSIDKYRNKLDRELKRMSLKGKVDNFCDKESDSSSCSSKNTLLISYPRPRRKMYDVTLIHDSDEDVTDLKSMTQKTPTNSRQSHLENINEQNSTISNTSRDEVIDISNDSDEENNIISNIKNTSGSCNNRNSTEKEKLLNNETNIEKSDDLTLLDDESDKGKNSTKNNDIDIGTFDNEWFNDLDYNDDWSSTSQTKIIGKKSQSSALTSDRHNHPTKGLSAKNRNSNFDSPQSSSASSSRDTRPSENIYLDLVSPQSPLAQSSKNVKTITNQYFELDTPQSPLPEDKFGYFDLPLSSSKLSEFDSPQSPPLKGNEEPSQNVRLSSSPILSQNRNKKKSIRKLQRKSTSTSNFETPPKKKMTKKSHEYEDILKNLSSFDTPQLNNELKKFGVKRQNRENAKLFLNHIYTKLVEQNSDSLNSRKRILTDDLNEDEPPLKKQSLTKSKQKKNSNSENHADIIEEIDSDECDDIGTSSNLVSIKDAFHDLLKTDKELYTKVLTYVPLPFNYLNSRLKDRGLKFKKNSLMDFLDQESITFQVETEKNCDSRKKKRKFDT